MGQKVPGKDKANSLFFIPLDTSRLMPDHTHLKQPTNICCFHGPLVTSKNSTSSYFNLFLRYSSVKNPAF